MFELYSIVYGMLIQFQHRAENVHNTNYIAIPHLQNYLVVINYNEYIYLLLFRKNIFI